MSAPAASETIVAVATPPGCGGIGVVRLSGDKAVDAANRIIGGCPPPRTARLVDFLDADKTAIDRGIALYFPQPNSFTGEPVLEFQCHGGPVVLQRLIRRCLRVGARLARPGEFSERAFLNGRMDLTQAEAVADLIGSSTESAARSAMNSLRGEFSKRVRELVDEVTRLRIFVEAAIDFPDEEIDFLEEGEVVEQLEHLQTLFTDLKSATKQGALLRDGFRVVLTGPPNAGKSSLLNRLADENRAIVSDIPGTTRDILQQVIQIDGLPVEIIDTAGIRETTNDIEAEGVRRAAEAQSRAGLILLLVDDAAASDKEIKNLLDNIGSSVPVLPVRNKIDLTHRSDPSDENEICISALTGQGLEKLKTKIKDAADFRHSDNSTFIARQRHIDALDRAHGFLVDGLEQQKRFRAAELLADDLTSSQRALGEITGAVSSDELLGMIFSSFCIGK